MQAHERHSHAVGSPQEAHPQPNPLRRLVDLFREERSDLGTLLLCSILSGVLYLATPLAVDAVVNSIAFGGEQALYVEALAILAITLFFLLAFFAVTRAIQDYVMEVIQRRLFVRLTADLAYRLPRVSMEALDEKQGPDLVNRFFEVITLQKTATALLLDGLNVVFGTLIGLALLGLYHPTLLFFALILLFLLGLLTFLPARPGVRTSIRESYAKHAVVAWLEQIAMFPVVFRTPGAAAIALERADILATEYLDARRAHFRVLFSQIIGLLSLQALASSALLIIGGWLVLRAEITLGQLVASELILSSIVASLSKLGKHLESWYDALAAVDKLGYLADLPIEREGGEKPRTAPQGAAVEMRSVTFGYDPNRPVLRGVGGEIPSGAKVGVRSPAGFGATTLLDLLVGFRAPQQGMISIDGLDVRHWQLDELRREVALVRGDDLIEGTVADNVRMGRMGVGLDEVRQALRGVGLLDTLLQHPDGLNARLHPGGRPLSSSQRRQLVLARALIGRPRLLLVDETLEGLSRPILQKLEELLFDRSQTFTLVLVTRDPHLLSRCDFVLELGNGPGAPPPSATESER